eukprot:2646473-Amphidinium_carterae.1
MSSGIWVCAAQKTVAAQCYAAACGAVATQTSRGARLRRSCQLVAVSPSCKLAEVCADGLSIWAAVVLGERVLCVCSSGAGFWRCCCCVQGVRLPVGGPVEYPFVLRRAGRCRDAVLS